MPWSVKKCVTVFLVQFSGHMAYRGFYQFWKIDNKDFETLYRTLNFCYYDDTTSFPKIKIYY